MQYQTLQINGTYSFAQNIKNLKIGDLVKLRINKNNIINSEAIGVYDINNQKIGYVPYKPTQINIKSKYTISKIQMNQRNPLLLISTPIDKSNFIQSQPQILKNKNETILKLNNEELNIFKKSLLKKNINLINFGIIYNDLNFIDLLIETDDTKKIIFNLITKKYYEDNIFIYDEFYKFKLIPFNIFQPFQIHRLENYLDKKYKSIYDLLKIKKVIEFKKNINLIFEKIVNSNLILFNNIVNNVYLNIYIKYLLSNNYIYYTDKITHINQDNFIYFKNMFNNLKASTISYNHEIKSYCEIDFYDDINIININTNLNLNLNMDNNYILELLLNLIISNKKIINIYNPINGIIFRLEPPQYIIDILFNLLKI